MGQPMARILGVLLLDNFAMKLRGVCRKVHAVYYREALATRDKVIKDAAEEVK